MIRRLCAEWIGTFSLLATLFFNWLLKNDSAKT